MVCIYGYSILVRCTHTTCLWQGIRDRIKSTSSGLRVHSATVIRVCVGVIDQSIFLYLIGVHLLGVSLLFRLSHSVHSALHSLPLNSALLCSARAPLLSSHPPATTYEYSPHKFSRTRRTWLVHDFTPFPTQTSISTRCSNDNSSPASWLHDERAARRWQVLVEARGNVRAARRLLLHAPRLPRVATPFFRFSNSQVTDVVQLRFRLLLANWAQLSAGAAASGGRNLHWHDILLLINFCRLRLKIYV